MSKIVALAKSLWSKALCMPGLANVLTALGIYALEQLISHLRDKKEKYYNCLLYISDAADE